MEKDKQGINELEKEKLKLEIDELRTKISSSKSIKYWEDFIRPLIPVIVTLIVAIGGWIITGNFNTSQQVITKSKNESDKKIAQINASLSYIKVMSELNDSSEQLKQHTRTIIAPALPPEASFFIAINELPKNENILRVLLRTYDSTYFYHLAPYLEAYPSCIDCIANLNFRTADSLPLFEFLDKHELLDSTLDFILSKSYPSRNRVIALINYLTYVYETQNLKDKILQSKLKYLLTNVLEQPGNFELKSDIANAASLILDNSQHDGYGYYTGYAAKNFWNNYDISIGEVPIRNSIEQILYNTRFKSQDKYYFGEPFPITPAIDTLSKSLFSKLMRLNFRILSIERISDIMDSYCEHTDNPNSYLTPRHSVQLIEVILNSLNTNQRKKEFSTYIYISGMKLFNDIYSQDNEAGKDFAMKLITWYQVNSIDDWYKPGVFSQIGKVIPELSEKIRQIE